jgi:hypothetical protein
MSRTPPDWTYLVAEVDAMAALLRRTRMLWRDYTSALLDGGPLMVLPATGCEKLPKLTFVLAVKCGRYPITSFVI